MIINNVALVISIIFLFGLSAFFRKLSVDRIHPYQLQVIASLIYIIGLPIWLWLINKNTNITSYNFLGTLYGILCLISYIIAAVLFGLLMKNSNSIGTLSTMIAINPIITSLLSYFFLNEQFATKKIIAMIITLVGISLFSL